MSKVQFRLLISIVFLCLNFVLNNSQALAQGKYTVFGKIKIENGSIANTVLTIYKNASKEGTSRIESNGKFSCDLDFGNDYILEFSKEGFVTKSVSVSTFVPADVLDRDSQFPPFKFQVALFPAYDGIDLSIFDQPMGMIMYDKEVDDFSLDKEYDAQIREAINKARDEARRRAEELAAQKEAKEKAYKAAILKGDTNFKAKEYDIAKEGYNEALAIKAEEAYPKSQLTKIDEILDKQQRQAEEEARLAAEQKALDEKYASIITLADSQFTSGDYQSAKTSYADALALKAEEAYPKSQLTKIDEILAEQQRQAEEDARLAAEKKALDEKYASIITLADSQFTSGDYPSAKTSYADALALKAEEAYPKSQLTKINELLAEQQRQAEEEARLAAEKKALDEKYASIITLADSQFTSGDYPSAKTSYTDALALKAEEAYPKSQLTKIDEILAEQQRQTEEEARLAAEKKALDEKYASIIALADSQFTSGDYPSAKTSYADALALKAEEAYPKSQLNKIDEILAEQQRQAEEDARLAAEKKALDEKYASIITLADSQFTSGDYPSAKTSYAEALALKAEEAYPKSQLTKIDEILAEQKRQAEEDARLAAESARLAAEKKALDEKYASIITLADSQFTSGDYPSAKTSYTDALALKTEEAYPKSQIGKIDEILAEQKRQAEEDARLAAESARLAAEKKALDEKYASIITLADSQFTSGDYSSAKTSYTDALALKAEEAYPKSQIGKIDEILAEQKKQAEEEARLAAESARLAAEKKALDDKYASIITLADSQFTSGDYSSAKTSYTDALALKADEAYPKSQITKIDELLAEQKKQAEEKARLAAESARLAAEKKALDDKYASIITLADSQFTSGDYSSAKTSYTDALALKAEEAYPKSQITKIDELLAEQKKQAEEEARLAAESARLAAEKKELDEKYNSFIQLADDQFGKEDYIAAQSNYKEALNLKFSEGYPKDQLRKISEILEEAKKKAEEEARLLAEQKLNDAKYYQLIAKADKYYEKEIWRSALSEYEGALKLKPTEAYPKERIKDINQILSEARKKEDEMIALRNRFNEVVEAADKMFKEEVYQLARSKYEEALDVLPKEDYPKNQIKRIDVILESLARAEEKKRELDAKYEKEINSGDSFFAKEEYSVARHHYKTAQNLKPKANYPKEKLDEIDGLLASLKKAEAEFVANNPTNFEKKLSIIKEREYTSIIEKADKAFDSEKYTVAKVMYERALEMFDRDHPEKRLNEIEKIIRDNKQSKLSKEYKELVARADKELAQGHLSVAKFYYKKANQFKEKDSYPRKQLKKIADMLAGKKNEKVKKEYDEMIQKADAAMEKKNYTVARFYYNKASKLNPKEEYPKEKLKTIESEQSKK